jgi:hypothetical protein
MKNIKQLGGSNQTVEDVDCETAHMDKRHIWFASNISIESQKRDKQTREKAASKSLEEWFGSK